MSTKSSPKPRSRKRPTKEEIITETVAPVHKPIKNEIFNTETQLSNLSNLSNQSNQSNQSNHSNHSNGIENKPEIETSSESNKTFTIEDKNENLNIQNSFISRDISVESELQINSKIERGIIGFMETEIIKEKSKYSHFTDSRPQSLSFYEEEKAPEELSGQLEQLSPEEKRVLKRQKHDRKIDIELDASTYKEIQNVLNREKEDQLLAGIIKSQKSKSRKKNKQFDSEESLTAGIGDSREQMIPSGKRKTKKSKSKSKESSPLPGSHKKKHRKRDGSPRNELTAALDELQDDVFEKDPNEITYQQDAASKLPNKSSTVYVQKRNGFEATPRDRLFSSIDIGRDDNINKRFSELSPIELALKLQKYWLPFTVLCHGLLAGLALAHTIVIHRSFMTEEFIKQYQAYAEPYSTAFYFLCIICVISVFDRYDVKHMNFNQISDIFYNRKTFIVIFIYIAALIVHLVNAPFDDQISNYNYMGLNHNNDDNNNNILANSNNSNSNNNMSTTLLDVINFEDLHYWNNLSMWRSILAIIGWIIVALSSNEDMLFGHLSNLEQFNVNPA